jgi:carbonic anhydrase
MDWLAKGIENFQRSVFPNQRDLFESLAQGQTPQVLFITCSDSRVDPNLITGSKPGELFHLRNAGNIVPPYGDGRSAEAATIEYAVQALGIRNIVVCGHTDCGAMKGLLHPEKVADLEAVSGWLRHSESARRVVITAHADKDETTRIRALIEQNVLAQLLHLQTHPAVAARLAAREMSLFGWVYDIGTGGVCTYRSQSAKFETLRSEVPSVLTYFNRVSELGATATGD